MGDETIEIASRFSNAVGQLARLAGDDTHAELARRHGARLPAVVRDALDAVEAVHRNGTDAVRNWPEQGRRVLARIAELRAALDRTGVGEEVRRLAGALVALVERGPERR